VRSGSSDFVLIGQNRTSFFRERSSVDVFPLCKDVLAKVSALKSASGALTNSLGHCSCKGAHVKGLGRLLSWYGLGRAQLFIATAAPAASIELVDLSALDEQAAPILQRVGPPPPPPRPQPGSISC